jgi:SAM-dependent MidA family methyltransferase
MLECRKHTLQAGSSQPLAIVEIGGGTGTLAASVLVRT